MKIPSPTGPVFAKGKGKIAIVLDDWGYSTKQLPVLASIHQPLTVSILPGLPHSADVAAAARRDGHQILLHMPMEALDPNAPREKEILLVGMSREQILATLEWALAAVPGVSGMNNHQGSKATSDLALMRVVLQDLKRRGLFYLDSFVTKQSVGEQAARETHVRFARRDVFLDNEENVEAIRKQIALLAKTAARRGVAIGIGHDRPKTLEVLREAVPALKKAGFTLVPVSELTEKER